MEREEYYARQSVPAAVRAEVESLLRSMLLATHFSYSERLGYDLDE